MITTAQLAEHGGITLRQAEHWTRLGLLRPAPGHGRRGHGHDVHYTREECRVARIMGDLVRAGLTPRAAAPAARQVARHGRAVLGGADP